MSKVKKDGPTVLYQGALANALASFVGSYPWFFTFNFCMANLPMSPPGVLFYKVPPALPRSPSHPRPPTLALPPSPPIR